MFTKTTLTLLFLLVSLTTRVYGEENSNSTTVPTYTSSPSSVPTQNGSDTINSIKQDPCFDYRCGDYSNASKLDYGNYDRINWTALFADRDSSPFQFIRAGVSCAYNPNRMIFDNDSIKRNNAKQMSLNVIENSPLNGFINTSSLTNETGESEEDDDISSIKIPSNIHIRVYAIDDDLEFKYRSHPCDLIKPIYDVLPYLEMNNKTYTNSSLLRFVWNRNVKIFSPRLCRTKLIFFSAPSARTKKMGGDAR